MIHIIDSRNATQFQPLLQGMFADRKRLFVDLFRWDVPVVDGEFEMDQFDTEHAVYLVAVSDEGDHDASLRLAPTTAPHMLGSVFPHLSPHGVPSGPTIWESSRLCLPQRHGAEGRRVLRNRLISAMVDVALQRGIEHYTGILPAPFRKEVLAMGWRGEPLGPAVPMPGGAVGAFLVHIDPDTPDRLRWSGTYVDAAEQVLA
jgi:acyl-homoserine lactone synthase